jgi:hypothetical protein
MPEDQSLAPAPPGDAIRVVLDQPGWVCLRRMGTETWLDASQVAAVRESGFGTDVVICGGSLISAGIMPAAAVVSALRRAATPLPAPANDSARCETTEALARGLADRRRALAEALQRQAATPRPEALRHALGAMRDRAIALATSTSHPRDWMLLLADACTEAAQQTRLDDRTEVAELFQALASTLAGEVRRLRTEAPPA